MGTVTPHDFLIQSPEAINIPPNIRIFQNNKDSDARADVMPVPLGSSSSEGLFDMITDTARQRLYIANSGLNRVEVFDMRAQKFLAPIKVGQLPHRWRLAQTGSRCTWPTAAVRRSACWISTKARKLGWYVLLRFPSIQMSRW